MEYQLYRMPQSYIYNKHPELKEFTNYHLEAQNYG